MQFEGIQGEVTGKYSGWIELNSCQLGAPKHNTNPSASPRIADVVVAKDQDSTSIGLFKASLSGLGTKVTIAFVKAAGAPYLTLELENAIIAGYSVRGAGHDSLQKPEEYLTLDFSKITYKTTAGAADTDAAKEKARWQIIR